MKQGFREDLRHIVSRILTEDTESLNEGLERCIACLAIALEKPNAQNSERRSQERLVSFGYVAASTCLWEMEQWTPFSGEVYAGSIHTVAIR